MYDFVVKGGVLMIPIALCSIIALAMVDKEMSKK